MKSPYEVQRGRKNRVEGKDKNNNMYDYVHIGIDAFIDNRNRNAGLKHPPCWVN